VAGDLPERMRRNPAADWTIGDVQTLCRQNGTLRRAPRGAGSHDKAAHSMMPEKLTIPFKRPIKPVHVRKLTAFVAAVRALG